MATTTQKRQLKNNSQQSTLASTAEIELKIKFLGKEYNVSGVLEIGQWGFWNSFETMCGEIPDDIDDAYDERQGLKNDLREVND